MKYIFFPAFRVLKLAGFVAIIYGLYLSSVMAKECTAGQIAYLSTSSLMKSCHFPTPLKNFIDHKTLSIVSVLCEKEWTSLIENKIRCSSIAKAMKKDLNILNCHGKIVIGKACHHGVSSRYDRHSALKSPILLEKEPGRK